MALSKSDTPLYASISTNTPAIAVLGLDAFKFLKYLVSILQSISLKVMVLEICWNWSLLQIPMISLL